MTLSNAQGGSLSFVLGPLCEPASTYISITGFTPVTIAGAGPGKGSTLSGTSLSVTGVNFRQSYVNFTGLSLETQSISTQYFDIVIGGKSNWTWVGSGPGGTSGMNINSASVYLRDVTIIATYPIGVLNPASMVYGPPAGLTTTIMLTSPAGVTMNHRIAAWAGTLLVVAPMSYYAVAFYQIDFLPTAVISGNAYVIVYSHVFGRSLVQGTVICSNAAPGAVPCQAGVREFTVNWDANTGDRLSIGSNVVMFGKLIPANGAVQTVLTTANTTLQTSVNISSAILMPGPALGVTLTIFSGATIPGLSGWNGTVVVPNSGPGSPPVVTTTPSIMASTARLQLQLQSMPSFHFAVGSSVRGIITSATGFTYLSTGVVLGGSVVAGATLWVTSFPPNGLMNVSGQVTVAGGALFLNGSLQTSQLQVYVNGSTAMFSANAITNTSVLSNVETSVYLSGGATATLGGGIFQGSWHYTGGGAGGLITVTPATILRNANIRGDDSTATFDMSRGTVCGAVSVTWTGLLLGPVAGRTLFLQSSSSWSGTMTWAGTIFLSPGISVTLPSLTGQGPQPQIIASGSATTATLVSSSGMRGLWTGGGVFAVTGVVSIDTTLELAGNGTDVTGNGLLAAANPFVSLINFTSVNNATIGPFTRFATDLLFGRPPILFIVGPLTFALRPFMFV